MHGSSSALKMELSRVSHFTILYRTLQPNCRTLSLDLARHGCHHRRQQDSRDGTWRGAGFPQYPLITLDQIYNCIEPEAQVSGPRRASRLSDFQRKALGVSGLRLRWAQFGVRSGLQHDVGSRFKPGFRNCWFRHVFAWLVWARRPRVWG